MSKIWKLSPIVGEVINGEASVTFELYNKDQLVTYSIKDISIKHNVTIEKNGPTKVILTFEENGNNNIFWVIDNELQFVHNVFVSNDASELIFVSCDLLEADIKHSQWTKIRPNKKTVIVHLGDQAYMDGVFNHCKKIMSGGWNEQDQNELCFLSYGERYCDTWRPHARLLANTSNYYLWDDHEITNNFKLNEINDDTIKLISTNAIKAYNKYQQSFHINNTSIINEYCWYKYLNDQQSTVILAIERMSRDIMLEEIFNAITELNNINKINRLILCFAGPPVPVPKGFYGELYKLVMGTGKFWEHDKLKILYDWLFDWMGNDKEVVVVGGDFHFGINGYMTKNNVKIPVLVASPITNQPSLDRVIASKGMCGIHIVNSESIDNIMTFTVISSKAKRCYGIVNLESEEKIYTNIIYSKEKYPKSLLKYVNTMLKF